MSEREWTVTEILTTTTDFLGRKDPSCPRLEAELLLSQVLNLERVKLYVNFDRRLTTRELSAYRELVRRRASHEPVAYILGRKEFYRLNLTVTPQTLIPRPETEHLVDEALRLIKESGLTEPELADLGCGSGAVALALAANAPGAKIEAVDLSAEALAVARANAQALSLADRITFSQGDLFAPLSERLFDLICANLPYVPDAELVRLPPDVALFEPRLALAGGPEGLDVIARLLTQAPSHLKPGGRVVLEIWPPSLLRATELAAAAGLTPLEPVLDYAKKDRIFVAQL
ncbi:MAG: peptide chain release factor N(5)-glutamine methyltransferase [Deltaproteobacteria bacterium]|jgi:release factor glutamine methyltransferase|nr:peptide chain release factor N(5)-glutamine methyltransferase [Deltaproteobacteria bacterium]